MSPFGQWLNLRQEPPKNQALIGRTGAIQEERELLCLGLDAR